MYPKSWYPHLDRFDMFCTFCGHVAEDAVSARTLENEKLYACATCTNSPEFTPDADARRVIAEKITKCAYRYCAWQGALEEREEHVRMHVRAGHKATQSLSGAKICPHRECTAPCSEEHIEGCYYRPVICGVCHKVIVQGHTKAHQKSHVNEVIEYVSARPSERRVFEPTENDIGQLTFAHIAEKFKAYHVTEWVYTGTDLAIRVRALEKEEAAVHLIVAGKKTIAGINKVVATHLKNRRVHVHLKSPANSKSFRSDMVVEFVPLRAVLQTDTDYVLECLE